MHLSLCVGKVFRCALAVAVVAAYEVDLHSADCWGAVVGVGKEVEKNAAVVVIVEKEFDVVVGWEALPP